jgi:hypothetical protein
MQCSSRVAAPTALSLIRNNSMSIYYLCVKTHKITGLKYLCQTSKNPFLYNGSGSAWKNHLKVYGKQHSTEVLKECNNKQELRKWGLYYSNLWNVVRDNNWANLKVEAGDGGELTQEIREKIRQGNLNRLPASVETRQKLSAAAKRRKGFTEAGLQKVILSNKSRVWTDEMREKLRQHNLGKPNVTQKGISQEKLTCPYCNLTGGKSSMKHWHFEKCKHK